MKHRWTANEIDLLFTNKTNEMISHEIGLPEITVRSARRYYTGHYCEPDKARYRDQEIASEVRIIDLAQKLGVRIAGVGRRIV